MAALAHELQLTLAVLAGVLGVLFLRHRHDVPGGGFGWLGAAYLLYLFNHLLTDAGGTAEPPRPPAVEVLVLLLATAALASFAIGLHRLAREAEPPSVPRTLSTFLLLWPVLNLMAMLARLLPPGFLQLLPALLLGYGAAQQWQCHRHWPRAGHRFVALMLASHPLLWLALLWVDVGPALAQELLSIPYVLAGLAILSVTLRRHQQRWQRLNAELEARLAAHGEEVRRAQQLITAREVERSRAAERERLLAEVHDGLGTQLSTAALRLERTDVGREESARVLRECLGDLQLLVDTLQDPRDSLHDALVDFRERCRARLQGGATTLHWQIELDDLPELPPKLRLDLLRIVQEALNNALRHAGATRIHVLARKDPDGQLELRVVDDGCGIGTMATSGRGLANMRRRARALGARLSICAADGARGTSVRVTLPLPVTAIR